MSRSIGIVGAGLVGRAWAITFARAGCSVALWDPVPETVPQALLTVETLLSDLEANGMLGRETAGSVRERIRGAASMKDAISDVEHVQENAPENVDTKRELFAQLDAVAPADAVIASSSTAILPSRFTADVPGRARCLVAHPINPPYLIPGRGNRAGAMDRCLGGRAYARLDAGDRTSAAGDGPRGGRLHHEPAAGRRAPGSVPHGG